VDQRSVFEGGQIDHDPAPISHLRDDSSGLTALIHDDPTSSQANEIEAGLVAGLAFVLRHAMASELDTGAIGTFSAFTDDDFFQRRNWHRHST
jgi:hypothetical protein